MRILFIQSGTLVLILTRVVHNDGNFKRTKPLRSRMVAKQNDLYTPHIHTIFQLPKIIIFRFESATVAMLLGKKSIKYQISPQIRMVLDI